SGRGAVSQATHQSILLLLLLHNHFSPRPRLSSHHKGSRTRLLSLQERDLLAGSLSCSWNGSRVHTGDSLDYQSNGRSFPLHLIKRVKERTSEDHGSRRRSCR
ncbi:hypothetical protein PMAYCL1PPCAC_01944, partial [Pristionchus mayeri]